MVLKTKYQAWAVILNGLNNVSYSYKKLSSRYRRNTISNGRFIRKPITKGDSDLRIAMKLVATSGKGPTKQVPSMGCNIKWFG